MLRKIIIGSMICMISLSVIGCSYSESEGITNSTTNTTKGKTSGTKGDGSQRRGGADKLERMNNGEGGRRPIE